MITLLTLLTASGRFSFHRPYTKPNIIGASSIKRQKNNSAPIILDFVNRPDEKEAALEAYGSVCAPRSLHKKRTQLWRLKENV